MSDLNMYEKKGIEEYRNKRWVWETLISCNKMYENLASNQDELPDILHPDLMEFMSKLLEIKYALLELIGRDSK